MGGEADLEATAFAVPAGVEPDDLIGAPDPPPLVSGLTGKPQDSRCDRAPASITASASASSKKYASQVVVTPKHSSSASASVIPQ
jgi:hypothetical protein